MNQQAAFSVRRKHQALCSSHAASCKCAEAGRETDGEEYRNRNTEMRDCAAHAIVRIPHGKRFFTTAAGRKTSQWSTVKGRDITGGRTTHPLEDCSGIAYIVEIFLQGIFGDIGSGVK